MNFLLGRLTTDAIPHEWFTIAGTIFIMLGGITVATILTYFKRWTWLWKEWLTSTDPKKIGIMYIIVAALMLFRGGVDAGMIWLQQSIASGSHTGYLNASHFQQIFTAHGTIMVFFVVMGFMFGMMNFILPLQIGARDVAFPFINSLSFWLYVAGVILVNMFFVVGGQFAAAGWLSTPPLSELAYSPGVGIDYWIWSLQISGLGSLLSGINLLVTTLKMRAPGMSLMKLPMFTWASLASMVLIIAAFPTLTITLILLSLDRTIGTNFFTATNGGSAMMYVNLIWSWGHPEVYILMIPSFGIYSEIVSVFSQKKLFGHTSIIIATILITLLSMLVWLHHFFTMGAGADVNAFFGIMTGVIAIPTGVLIFNWLATMFRGKIILNSILYYFIGFVVLFTVGGMAGVLLGTPGVDYEVHNTLFLVAHFHTMVVGGALFGIFAGLTYWWPKVTGFKLNDAIGKYAFWLWLVGFLTSFIPLYVLGFMGATRRMDHYDASLGYQPLFIVSLIGFLIICCAAAVQVWQIVYSIIFRKQNLDSTGDPWNGRTLEWATSSPPPEYNFAIIPIVGTRDAWWEIKQHSSAIAGSAQGQAIFSADSLPRHSASTEVTADKSDALGADNDKGYQDIEMPKNTAMGIYVSAFAFALSFAMVWHLWWLAIIGLVGVIVCLILRSLDEKTEYIIPAAEVEKLENFRNLKQPQA